MFSKMKSVQDVRNGFLLLMSAKGQGWSNLYELPLSRAIYVRASRHLRMADWLEASYLTCRLNILSFFNDVYAKRLVGTKYSQIKQFRTEIDI